MNSLSLISSMAPRDILRELIWTYMQTAQVSVTLQSAGGVDVAKRVLGGELFDIVVLSSDAIEKLFVQGAFVLNSRVDLMRSDIAVAVPDGHAAVDILSEDAVKSAVRVARSISYSTGPSGIYIEKLIKRWGLFESVQGRLITCPPGTPVAALLATGKATLGFQQLSELIGQPGIRVLGTLPAKIQHATVFSGAIGKRSKVAADALSVLRTLNSESASLVKTRYGMEAI